MLTQKKRNFAQSYFECGNATESYRKSYNCKNMKEKSIRDEASRLLKDPDITQYLNNLNSQVDKKVIMSAEERMIWLSNVVNGKEKEIVAVMTTDSDGNSKMIEQKFPSKLDTKLKALYTLNKMDNAYQQNIKIEGTLNNPYNGLTEEELRKLADN